MLDEIQSKDVGPIGETLEQLMKKLKEVNPDELSQQNDNFLKKLFKRSKIRCNNFFSNAICERTSRSYFNRTR